MSEALEKSRIKWLQFGLLVVLSGVCALLLVDVQAIPEVSLKVGEPAARDLVTPVDLNFVDSRASTEAQKKAAAQVPSVFAYEKAVEKDIRLGLSEAFAAGRSALEEAQRISGAEGLSEEAVAAVGRSFLETSGIVLEGEPLQALVERSFPEGVEELTLGLLDKVMWRYVISDASFLPEDRAILVSILEENEVAEELLDDRQAVWTVPRTKRDLKNLGLAMQTDSAVSRVDAELAVAISVASVRPNFSQDQAASAERRQRALQAVPEVERKIARGSLLIRAGEEVTPWHVELGNILQERSEAGTWWKAWISTFLLCLFFVGGITRFCMVYVKKFSSKRRDLIAISVLLILGLGLARFVIEVCEAASSGQPDLPVERLWFLAPVAGCALLVRVLLNSETALGFSLVVGVFCGMAMGHDVYYAAYFMLTGIVACGILGLDSDRKAVLKAGLIAGAVGAVFILLAFMVQQSPGESRTVFGGDTIPWMAMLFSVVGGLFSAFLVLALLPLFEMFGFVTDLQLLELSNLNHPLLSNLLMRAPGSYHHSVMVGTLAEASAKEVGCNPLLCRVAAYFHDIGKAVSPQYFVENQKAGVSPHKRLSPEMSARVIIDHVRNGGEVARRHKLPKPIIDNIYMHHGTGLLYFFYRKAQKADPNVDPELFRYPGPKPNTREAGIVHLADKVEAACRSIKEPTPDRIRQMIQRIISTTLADGQLEECPLTLQDLYLIAGKFEEVILAIHHQRIEYPDTADVSSQDETPTLADEEEKVVTAVNDESGVITLDLPPREGEAIRRATIPFQMETEHDYESADALPEDTLLGSGKPPKA